MLKVRIFVLAVSLAAASVGCAAGANPASASASRTGAAQGLAAEVRNDGWLVFSARIQTPNWNLFIMRPDGSARRRITDSPQFNEAGARFSPDGKRLLYYRMPASQPVDNNTYGTFALIIAKADGTDPEVYGKGYAWASWGPNSRQIACLTLRGIEVVDLATREVVRQIPRHGIVQQLIWSPNGEWFVGTANGLGPYWNIGVLNATTSTLRAVSETDRYNCTPDWCADSLHVVYARGIIPEKGGFAELWTASIDGRHRRRIYAEPGHHIYGACASPDGRYVLFTRSVEDLGRVISTKMALIRWPVNERDADSSSDLRSGPPVRLDLGPGWEPHWTSTDILMPGKASQPRAAHQ
jgi:Tol biopolymer transport system component